MAIAMPTIPPLLSRADDTEPRNLLIPFALPAPVVHAILPLSLYTNVESYMGLLTGRVDLQTIQGF